MELNREAVFDKRLDVVEIAKKVVAYFDGGLHVIRSDQNSEKLVSGFVLTLMRLSTASLVFQNGGFTSNNKKMWRYKCLRRLITLVLSWDLPP